jgi:hypothetical protein
MPIPPLGPGAGYRATINAPDGLPAQILGQLRNGTLTMFVYGMVRYSDAFGGHRYLNFRYESGAAAGGAWNALVTCREGNDSDAPD